MKIDMYRIYFPAGVALGFWGAFVWVLHAFNLIEYPGVLHPEIMMGGFLLAFVAGFLCTAVPKFTDSFPPTRNEFFISLLLILSLFTAQLIANIFYFRLCSFSIFIYLTFFIVRRFVNRRANPPAPFLFIGVGLVSGLFGSLILLLSNFDFISLELLALGRLFIVQGYILSFVLGIGSRLIPALLGVVQDPRKPLKLLSVKNYMFLGILFLFTYFVEAFFNEFAGMILRDLIIVFVAFFSWKIHLLPKRKAIHAYGLWLSCWFLLIGHIGASLFVDYKIHLMHLFYIGGLSLLTLLVATRVILSHGGHEMGVEIKSKTLIAFVSLVVLAALTRFSAGILPFEYTSHLLYAASVWILALVLWGRRFIPTIITVKYN